MRFEITTSNPSPVAAAPPPPPVAPCAAVAHHCSAAVACPAVAVPGLPHSKQTTETNNKQL